MIHFFPRIGKAWAVHLEQRVKAWGGWGLGWVGLGVGGAWLAACALIIIIFDSDNHYVSQQGLPT